MAIDQHILAEEVRKLVMWLAIWEKTIPGGEKEASMTDDGMRARIAGDEVTQVTGSRII